ncbi:hypothetical protein VHUM_04368 [Vanrija humicola]|uniref:Alpha-galactosidase n=1 Tax=Vanrija humicola TaxID=5417 RepID=A0A7D8Z512_VANHU|nr:hypothetical protein VHUM_04368 [Vanrija humicola]
MTQVANGLSANGHAAAAAATKTRRVEEIRVEPPTTPAPVDGESQRPTGPTFHLNPANASYIIRVNADGDLEHVHWGARTRNAHSSPDGGRDSWGPVRTRREFPDAGHGDFRQPAYRISHGGTAVTDLRYVSYDIVAGKPPLLGLPATFGADDTVSTLEIHLEDKLAGIKATLSYGVFHHLPVVTRSVRLTAGPEGAVIDELASLSIDFPVDDYEMLHTYGQWARENQVVRRKVDHGTQGFQSLAGYTSAAHNPFFALVNPTTTESLGQAWGFNLVYTGSFAAQVEVAAKGYTRASLGLNPAHLSWALGAGESFTSPEVVCVYSGSGIGGMSRAFHSLYRNHLSRSDWTHRTRPTLINNWEATYFDLSQDVLLPIAERAAGLGIKMFVMDDGWFGVKHPRINDHQGLGDWTPNPHRFPDGLGAFAERVTDLKVKPLPADMKFGIWVEPEMVSPKSELYENHPSWVLHAGKYPQTTARNQLVLNAGLPEVQDYIVDAVTKILSSGNISYVKWDNNRGMHELQHPSDSHRYILGLYSVLDRLTTAFPDVLWEGCASGGARFDPGLLYYWPQHWVSDNTDARDRVSIQLGLSLVYPPSTFGCHVSAVPNHITDRETPLEFRAHVAMMGGSFGLELDATKLSDQDTKQLPAILALSEKVNPYVIHGDMYRLSPWTSSSPAVQYVLPSGDAVLFAYQLKDAHFPDQPPPIRLQGLEANADYEFDGEVYGGDELLTAGWNWWKEGDYQSRVVFVNKLK